MRLLKLVVLNYMSVWHVILEDKISQRVKVFQKTVDYVSKYYRVQIFSYSTE